MSKHTAAADLIREFKEFLPIAREAREQQEKYGQVLGDTQAKVDAINQRLDALEVALKRPAYAAGVPEVKSKMSPEAKAAFAKFLRKGAASLSPDEVKLLTISDDTGGGYLSSDDLVQEIIKDIVEWSPIREVARIRTTGKRSVKIRKRTQTAKAVFVAAERHTKTETQNPAYGMEEIPNHELYAMADISTQDLEDSDFDLEAELRSEFAEQFGVAEGEAMVNGLGKGEPEGLLGNAEIKSVANGHETQLKFTGLVALIHDLKTGYARRGQLLLNRRTIGKVRMMTDEEGNPLWAPLANGAPPTILGITYTEVPDLPDVKKDATPILFGDFRSGYIVVDRVAISILRDDFTRADKGVVRFIARKRVGGQVINPEAIRKLVMKAA